MVKKLMYSRADWKKYLDPTNNPRVVRFLKANGRKVLSQIVDGIQEAIENDTPELVVLIHPNVKSIVIIQASDYDDVLAHALLFFKSVEGYEQCSNIVNIRKKLKKEKVL